MNKEEQSMLEQLLSDITVCAGLNNNEAQKMKQARMKQTKQNVIILCPNCYNVMKHRKNYCGHCGQRVKLGWE